MAAIVNTPQILLSIAYLAYNGLFTRMHGEREWSSYSVKYKPLRVSYARGLQTVAYRLQLPFRWSIPLISLSALLHWLVSNCLYIRDSRSKFFSSLAPLAPLASSRSHVTNTRAK